MSSLKMSRIRPTTMPTSSCTSMGQPGSSAFFSTPSQRSARYFTSLRMALSSAVEAAVRMMKAPVSGRVSCRIDFRRTRSRRSSILRDTPTWVPLGMCTRKRPGRLMSAVRRGPLLLMGSLVTCTRISSPTFSMVSMGGMLALRPGRPRVGPGPSTASDVSGSSWITSEACKNPARSNPISTNAACRPGLTEVTLPL